MYNEIQRYQVQYQKDKGNGYHGIGQQRNWQGTEQDKSRRLTRIYPTLYTFVQQEEI